MARYIFVTGGVVSSLGKGLSSASLAYLLKNITNLDGFLVGGASQNSNIFIDIIKKTFN